MPAASRLSLLFLFLAIPIVAASLPAIPDREPEREGETGLETGMGTNILFARVDERLGDPDVIQFTATPGADGLFTPVFSPTPTPTATNTGTPIIRLDVRSRPVLYAFIRAPSGLVKDPFVILTAYRSLSIIQPLQITGRIGNIEFICPGTPCRVPVTPNAQVSFQARDPFGGASSEVRALVRVESTQDGYRVSLDQIAQFFAHQDACSIMWKFDAADTANLLWTDFPQQPELLATRKPLYYLAGQLIRSGMVRADDCPGKGFTPQGAVNLCGTDKARSAMIAWQNIFDFDIWLASKDVQLPPRLLKVLIETESQFWPANERAYVDEFGLGQINQLGIDVLLRQDPALYHLICPSVLGDCSVPYPALPDSLQKLIRGALLNSLNAECKTCPYGIDVNVARQSITAISLLLRANCRQVANVMDFYDATATYEDYWKFTLMSYHGGLSCVENAVEKLTDEDEDTDWKHVAHKSECRGAAEYVERVWTSLSTFDDSRLPLEDEPAGALIPEFLPTPTPIPTLGPPPSRAVVWVIVVLDENSNGIPEENEWVNGIPVTLNLPDGTERSALTANGKAVFDLTGLPTGLKVTASLPTLYRSSSVIIPQQGIVPIVFVFFPAPVTPGSP